MVKGEKIAVQQEEIGEKKQSLVIRLFHTAGDLVNWMTDQFEPIGDNYWRSVHNTGQGRGKHPIS